MVSKQKVDFVIVNGEDFLEIITKKFQMICNPFHKIKLHV